MRKYSRETGRDVEARRRRRYRRTDVNGKISHFIEVIYVIHAMTATYFEKKPVKKLQFHSEMECSSCPGAGSKGPGTHWLQLELQS